VEHGTWDLERDIAMDARHLRAHLRELAGRRRFLVTLRPDSERYKLWLGDIVELVNVAYGVDSDEMREVRAILGDRPRPPAPADDAERERAYLDRLEQLGGLLERLAGRIPEPIVFVESDGERR
jgi:hypothetical protein